MITPDLLPALNSMTKYPSIPTYHQLNPKTGMLTDSTALFFGQVYGTEKVDGTNGRIVVTPDGDWFVGSREEWFTARDDRIPNTQLRIAETLAPLAQQLADRHGGQPLTVYYLEVYGYGVGSAAKQYAQLPHQVDYRLFDVAVFHDAEEILNWPRERIASWRDRGSQPFLNEGQLVETSLSHDVPLTPRLFQLDASVLPHDFDEMHALMMSRLPTTGVAMSREAGRVPEGIVLRDYTRSTIAKARFQDYERTAKRRKSQATA